MAKVNFCTAKSDLYGLVERSSGNGRAFGAKPGMPCPNILGR